jgi:hypothetical protein
MKRNRPDLGTFTPGTVYRHSATWELVEFVGVAYAARADDDEDVAVFRPVERPGPPMTADRSGWDRGERFDPVPDVDRAVLEVPEPGSPPLRIGRVDRNDIFGLRQALDALPDGHRDLFIQQWAQIADRCEYDLTLIRTAVLRQARECRFRDADLADAWTTVGAAMAAYLAWRSTRDR